MIRLTRLDGSEVTVNCDLIESVERTPDTVVMLSTGRKFVARESVDEVVVKVTEFKRQMGVCPLLRGRQTPGPADRRVAEKGDLDWRAS